jgi:hypothetical protein
MDDDWAARTAAAGVFYSHNFTYRDAAKTVRIANDADLRASAWGVGGTPSLALWDQAHKLSGAGSLRLQMPAANRGAYTGYSLSWDGVGRTTKNTSKHQFYVQFAIYADSVYRNFHYGDVSTWGGKLAIVQAPDRSFEPSEIVLRRDIRAGGYVLSYRYTPNGGAEGFSLSWPALSNYTYMNFYDRGSPTSITTNSHLRQRYGTDYQMLGSDNQGTNPDYQNAPRLVDNGWTVFEMYIDQVNQIVKIWMAPYGQPPVLVMGAMNARIAPVGTMDGGGASRQIYTGMQLLNYPNNVTNWPTTDTFICYSEVVASDNPINFPGGLALPSPGTQRPANYPPSGAQET